MNAGHHELQVSCDRAIAALDLAATLVDRGDAHRAVELLAAKLVELSLAISRCGLRADARVP